VTWLLVEDDPDIRNVVAVMMQLWGERALALADGNAAWAWLDSVEKGTLKDELPDLALMDIRMPGHTGDQIAARIRQTEKLKNIPIILMTAFTLTDSEVQAMMARAGIDHLIKKPLPDMDVFKATLYKIRDERRKANAAPQQPAVLPVVEPKVAAAPGATPPAAAPVTPPPAVPAPSAWPAEAMSKPIPAVPPVDAKPAVDPAPKPTPPATPGRVPG
jgi:CheY-like chemotaxis protein